MVYRIFTERKDGFQVEAEKLLSDIKGFLKINEIEKIRLFNCYDVENISKELGTGGRIILRESGTEPVLRIMVEAQEQKECYEYIDRMVLAIREAERECRN